MNKFEFQKEWFYKEEERKENLNSSLNIPIGILTAIIAGIYFLASNYNYFKGTKLLLFSFIILIIGSALFWIISIYFLLKSYNNLYKGYSYKGFPSSNFIKIEYDNLTEYYENNKSNLDHSITLESLVESNIEIILTKCIETNAFNNDRKSVYLHHAKTLILNCLIALFFSSVLFTINHVNS